MDAAQRVFQTFLDQWKTGSNAELKFFCEGGSLRVNLSADLGPWSAPAFEPRPNYGSLSKATPSRLRRRLRRASEQERIAAAKDADAEKNAAENAAAEVNTTDENAAEEKKAALEKATAEKAAAETAATEKAEIEMTTAVVEDAEKATAEKETIVEVKAGNVNVKNVASSSSCGVGQQSASAEKCWNCDREFTPNHQCDNFPASELKGSDSVSGVSTSPDRVLQAKLLLIAKQLLPSLDQMRTQCCTC